MEPLVVVDTSVLLAACLGPSIDAKAELAANAFRTLSEAGIRTCITETIQREFEGRLYERVGQVLDATRDLAQAPAPDSDREVEPLDALEGVFATLRSKTGGAAGALLVLETRVLTKVREQGQLTEDAWTSLLRTVAAEAGLVLAEVQRRFDLVGVEVLPRPKGLNVEPFRDLVDKSDLEHIASCDALASSKRRLVLFITLDGKLLAARSEIGKRTMGRVVITSPVFLDRALKRESSQDA